MKQRLILGLLIAGSIIIALWASTMLIAVTDRAYICETTGSRKGFREWFFGAHTNTWYRESEIERFMEANDIGQTRDQVPLAPKLRKLRALAAGGLPLALITDPLALVIALLLILLIGIAVMRKKRLNLREQA